MKRLIALGGLVFCTCALTTPAAVASGVRTVGCRYEKALVPDNPGPVKQLRIRQGAGKVDNYLDRCQVATFVAGAADGPKTLHLHGARWFIGVFHAPTGPIRGRARS